MVVSRFNELVTKELLAGARQCLLAHRVEDSAIDVYWVPGAFELPAALARVAALKRHDGIVALGCVIRGATPHFEYVAGAATQGIADIARTAAMPVTFGLLTTDTLEQALERAGAKAAGNKGWDAARCALEMCSLLRQIE